MYVFVAQILLLVKRGNIYCKNLKSLHITIWTGYTLHLSASILFYKILNDDVLEALCSLFFNITFGSFNRFYSSRFFSNEFLFPFTGEKKDRSKIRCPHLNFKIIENICTFWHAKFIFLRDDGDYSMFLPCWKWIIQNNRLSLFTFRKIATSVGRNLKKCSPYFHM